MHSPSSTPVSVTRGDADAPGPTSRLSHLLRPERIALDVPVRDADALFAHIGALVPMRDRAAATVIARRLARRHARRSTAIGGGAALPHAEITHLPAPLAVFVRPSRPLPFGAADGHPVRNVVALLVPKPATSADHALLADLTQWLQQPGLHAALGACDSAGKVWRVLAHWPWM